MQTFLLGLRAVAYAMLGVAAILGLIYVLMTLVGRLAARKPPVEDESPPPEPSDDENPPEATDD